MRKALLLTLGLLAAFELVVRLVLFPASGDFLRFGTYDAQARALTQSSALRVAVIGNSAAEEGIDRTQLSERLAQRLGRPVKIELFFADGSEMVTWSAMLDRYFWSTGAEADVYVLNYFGTLADTPRFEYIRVGMFFARVSDWPYYLNEQLSTLSERVDFFLSSSWATFGARDRIRDRVLTMLIPGYRDLLRSLIAAPTGDYDPRAAPETRRFTAFDRSVGHIAQRKARLIVAAFPHRDFRYAIDPQVQARANRGEFDVVDLRHGSALSPSDYRDGIHLLAKGRSIYTTLLAEEIARVIGAPR